MWNLRTELELLELELLELELLEELLSSLILSFLRSRMLLLGLRDAGPYIGLNLPPRLMTSWNSLKERLLQFQ